jgi:septum site-determining protein MinC
MSLPTAAAYASPPLVFRMNEAVPVLVLQSEIDFEALRQQLRFHLPEHLAALADRTLRIDLQHREIRVLDLRRLSNFLRDEFSIELTGLYIRSTVLQKFAERELKFRLFLNDPPANVTVPTVQALDAPAAASGASPVASVIEVDAAPAPANEPVLEAEAVAPEAVRDVAPAQPSQRPTIEEEADLTSIELPSLPPRTDAAPEIGRRNALSVHRTLRSGSSIRHDGDVYLFGDVNPGAQISASGNIIVLGALKGMAHAGHGGDESAFIVGFDFRPTQVRIGRRIAVAPARTDGRPSEPEIAHIVDGQIVIEPYRSRSR